MGHAGYTLKNVIEDPLLFMAPIPEGTCMPIDFLKMTLYTVGCSSSCLIYFPGAELEAWEENFLWNPISNYTMEKLDRRYRDSDLHIYISTKGFLMQYVKKERAFVQRLCSGCYECLVGFVH